MTRTLAHLALALVAAAAFLAPSGASASVSTNEPSATDAVTVKGWRRTYVYGTADGRLVDPSGKIASYASGAAEGATTKRLSEIADAAEDAAAKNLERMYSVTNLLATFTKKIFVKAHLYPDLVALSNCWGRIAGEWTDGTNDHCWVYFSRELKIPPTMKRVYRSETETNAVEGVWTDFTNETARATVDGYEGCREIVYVRPAAHVMQNCFPQPYLRFGTEEGGFDLGTRVFTLDDELGFTGAVTNSTGKVWWYNNGIKVREEQDVQ